ncbi:MAG: hypothetical protein Kow00105_04170 [Phycisphaeraceae bacterium]
MIPRRLVRVSVLAGVGVSVLFACTPVQPVADPVAVMLDRLRDPARRLAAAEQLGAISQAEDPEALAQAMTRLFWSDAQPASLRLLAMNRLLEYDPQAFWRTASWRILQIDHWPVLQALVERAVQTGDPARTPMLVRSLARTSRTYRDDTLRPEYAAIEALNPGRSVESVVFDVMVGEDRSRSAACRVDAWALLNRLIGPGRAREMLAAATTQPPVVADLRDALWLDVLPANRETVLWLMRVRELGEGRFWRQARETVEQLTGEQRQGVALRHLPVLLTATAEELTMTRLELLRQLQVKLSRVEVTRRAEAGNRRVLPAESLADHASELCFADLLNIQRVVEALRDSQLIQELFRQADADYRDKTTEHGGVLAAETNRCRAIAFAPLMKSHDRAFHASDELIRRLYTGLAHYHFHAQSHRNGDYAGPGPGDLRFVENLGAAAVVLTFLDENTLAVDYYQPNDVVLDLGTIRR